MKMTYIHYLNAFNQWLETNALPASSQLMFYKLLYVFNRAGWAEYVEVDNLRLMLLTDTKSEKTVIRARDRLVEAGFITYKKGRKGRPNQYFLCDKHCKHYSINDRESDIDCKFYSISDSISYSISDSISDSISASHIKTKKKTKTKNITPQTPQKPEWSFGEELTAAFSDWLAYKQEKRQPYTPTSLLCLVKQVQKHAQQYGEAAVAGLIRDCMASNWQGIIWDKLERRTSANMSGMPKAEDTGQAFQESVRNDIARMGKILKKMRQEEQDMDGCEEVGR